MKRTLPLLLAAAMLATCADDKVDLTKPPSTPPLSPFKLPPTTEASLPDGLKLVMVRDTRFPILTARLVFNAGSKYDPANLIGLAETAGSLLKEGTTSRSSKEIAERLAAIGASLSVDVNADTLIFSFSGLSDNAGELFEIISDVVRNASFPQDEVDLRKSNRKQELLAQRSQASTLVNERFHKAVFGSNPYSIVMPTAESIERIQRNDLQAFRQRFIVPNNAWLVMVSPIAPAELTASVRERFGAWEKKSVDVKPLPAPPAPRREIVLVDRPDSVQADIMVGRLAVKRQDPEYFPLLVSNATLGFGAASRLFRIIREKEGFAYDAHSALTPLKESSFAAAGTQVRNEVLEPALKGVLAQMSGMGTAPPTAEEEETAKNLLTGVYSIRLETPDGIASQLAMVKSMGLPNDYMEKYISRIRAVTTAQMQEVSKKYIDPENSAIVVVGDASKIGAALGKFGEVKVEKP
jgi:zinc protease